MAYVAYPYDGEELDDVLTAALTRLAETLPGWTPRETHVAYALLSETLRHVLDTRLLAADVADSVFRVFGSKLVGLAPTPGTPATGTAVFDVKASASTRTIPAGTEVLWPSGAGDVYLFATATAVTIAAGATSSPGVQLVAAEPGTAANDLPAGPLELVDALTYVTGVRGTTETSGGTDPETDADYLDRLSQSLTLLRRIPVRAREFAVLARDVPGVHRALALDNYDSDTATSGVERTVSLAVVDAAGQPVPTNVADAVRARVAEEREVNFVVRVMAPTYTVLDVAFTVRAAAGADPVAVVGDAVDAVRGFLSPAVWGGGDARPPRWDAKPTVRYLDLAGVVSRTPGVAEVVDVTLNGARVDVTLAGVAPLPAASSTVSGAVAS